MHALGGGVCAFSLLAVVAASARADAPLAHAPDAGSADPNAALPAEHRPLVSTELKPASKIATGDSLTLAIRADAPAGDDVTVPEQAFSPFEILNKRARVEPVKDGRQTFVFELELLALDAGKQVVPGVELRIVTKDGLVGSVKTQPLPVEVVSPLGNEPNAKLKPETQPVVVTQEDKRPLYVLYALGGAALIALLTFLLTRYLSRRERPVPPPPPPRPPWEVAVEKLADLRRRKSKMIEQGLAAQFVDEVSDVVREYLGGRFGFDGLETTTDEMLATLRARDVNVGLWQEVGTYLRRCDLVKFAKVNPDADEADLVFAKAQDIVQFSAPPARNAAAVPVATDPTTGQPETPHGGERSDTGSGGGIP